MNTQEIIVLSFKLNNLTILDYASEEEDPYLPIAAMHIEIPFADPTRSCGTELLIIILTDKKFPLRHDLIIVW